MENNGDRGPSRVQQFKNISEADKRLLGRFVIDRTEPRRADAKNLDMTALSGVFRRTVRDTSDIQNIFKVMPDLNLPRDILVSAICAPGDLATTTLLFEAKVKGTDSQLISALIMTLDDFFIKDRHTDQKVSEWVDDALIIKGAHPIMIIPEASIDRMVNGSYGNASMESVATYDGEWANGWFKPKGIFGLRLPTGEARAGGQSADFISLESSRGRINTEQMVEYHTIKAAVPLKSSVSLPFRVTDNMAVLRAPAVQQIKRARTMNNIYGSPALESRRRDRLTQARQDEVNQQAEDAGTTTPGVPKKKRVSQNMSDADVYSRFFRPAQALSKNRMEVVPTLKQSGGKTIGHPLEYHLPTEAVVPICVPGDPTNHVGYIIILDGNGFPVASIKGLNYYEDIRRGSLGGGEQTGSGSQVAGELLNMANTGMNGGISNANDAQINRLVALHGDIICSDLIARLKSGLMGGDFEISRSDYIDRLMLARTAKNQQTTLLYVPAELMIYMAYDYNEYGIGKSILEDAKSLAAMRANLMVASVMGSAANAIPGKDINIELDPDDGDPMGTATFLASEAMALAYNQFPMSISSPQGISEALQMTSYSVNVTGNPRFPEVKTSITPRESQQVTVDTEFMQLMRDDIVRVFSITPEMVDGMNQPDFATTAVNNSLMLLKRVMVIQKKTNPQLSDYVRLYTMNSGILIDQLMEQIESNKKFLPPEFKDEPESFLQEFINALEVSLPAPDTDNLEKHLDLYTKYSDGLDKVMEAFIKDEFFDGYTGGVTREALPTILASWKGVQLRKFLRQRGLFRDLDIFGNAEDGSPLMELNEEMASHVEALTNAFGEYSKRAAKDAIARKTRNDVLMALDTKAKATLDAPIDTDPDNTPQDEETPEETPPEDGTDLDQDEPTPEDEKPAEEPPEEEEEQEEETTDDKNAAKETAAAKPADDGEIGDDDMNLKI